MRITTVAVLFSLSGTVPATAECWIFCEKVLVTFAENPLVKADVGMIPFITPDMVEGGPDSPCTANNNEGFTLGTPDKVFVHGGTTYSKVVFFDAGTGTEKWLTLDEIERVVAEICQAPTS